MIRKRFDPRFLLGASLSVLVLGTPGAAGTPDCSALHRSVCAALDQVNLPRDLHGPVLDYLREEEPNLEAKDIALPFQDVAASYAVGYEQTFGPKTGAVPPRAQVPFRLNGVDGRGVWSWTVGYGCRLRFSPDGSRSLGDQAATWYASGNGYGEQLATWFETGAGWKRRRLEGAAAVDLRFHRAVEHVQVETLHRSLGRDLVGLFWRPSQWTSTLFQAPVQVRGLVPLAGTPGVHPGHADGSGEAIRCADPFGMAVLPPPKNQRFAFLNRFTAMHFMPDEMLLSAIRQGKGSLVAVTEPSQHVIRCLRWGRDGTMATPWGKLGEAGHVDGSEAEARFNRPTFLAPLEEGFLVADSGNHRLRLVVEGRGVTTWAGSGRADHQDHAHATQAAFQDPQGLAVDRRGRVFVADRGNHCIRMVGKAGQVSTIAGRPKVQGHQDGVGCQALFRDLRGLALDVQNHILFAADGHCIRRIDLDPADPASCAVTTVVGDAQRPGFQPLAGQPLAPCLHTPVGISLNQGHLFIADSGNRCVRVLDVEDSSRTLGTLVGDPEAGGGIQWGPCRDDLSFQPKGYAALDQVRTVLFHPGAETLLIAAGTCLAQVPAVHWRSRELRRTLFHQGTGPELTAPASVVRRVPFALTLGLPWAFLDRDAAEEPYRVRLHVDDPRGGWRPLPELEVSRWDFPLALEASLPDPGPRELRAVIMTAKGLSFEVARTVTVREQEEPAA